MHPADRERVRVRGITEVTLGNRFALEYRVLTATGSERWVRDVGQPFFDPRAWRSSSRSSTGC